MFSLGKNKKITVHNGRFHADDVFAVGILGLVYGWNKIKIVRTRDREAIEKSDIVVDVGGVYDPDKLRFDHHQKEGAGTRENGIAFASCGLVWQKFGRELCNGDEEIFQNIDKKIFAPIDADDNGILLSETKFPGVAPFSIGEEIDILVSIENDENENYNNFIIESKRASKILALVIKKQTNKKIGRQYAKDIYESSPDKGVIVLDKWVSMDVFVDLQGVYFVVYPNKEKWNIGTVPIVENSFDAKKSFPASWLGLMNEDLEKITGVSGSIFCHKAGFLCGAQTKESAIKLAKLALNA